MAQIPSYTTGSLRLSDYLIGTDVSSENVTRSMPVSDIVASILAAKSIGTVTSISTSNSTYINLAGGPITTTGSLTASLSAGGTPSSTTYLRGDGTWSEPGPTPTDIISQKDGNDLTLDTAQWNFIGTGVSASSINNNVNVDIPGLLASVEAILAAPGIDATGTVTSNPSTGDVTIANIGVYQARAGGNVTLTGSATPLQYSSAVTVSTTANAGTVFSLNPGVGINIVNNTTLPEADINYTGLNNYITSNVDTIFSDDIIAFQDLSASEVKTAKLNTIPASSLVSVKNTIDGYDNGKVKNIDAFTNVWKAKEMVTLTLSEYNTIPIKDKNTLYLIVGPGTAYTATLNPTYNITGGSINQGYTASADVNDGTGWVPASSLTAVAGTVYEWRISLALINGYTYVSGNLVVVSGSLTMPSSNTTDNLTITATIQAPPSNNCTVTLNLIDQTTGVGAGSWNVTSGSANGATDVVTPQTAQFNFNTVVGATGGYSFNTGPYYNGSITSGFTGNGNGTSAFTFDGKISGSLGPVSYTGTLNHPISSVLNSDITVIGSSDTAYQLVGFTAWQSYSPSGFGQVIGGLNAGDSFSWGKGSGGNSSGLDFTIANQDSAGNAYQSNTLVWKTAAGGGGSTISWPYGGSIPGGGGSQQITAYLSGTITYQAQNPTNEVFMNWTSVSITDSTSAGYNLSPAQNASSNPVAVGNNFTISPGSASVTMVSSGQYLSSGGTPSNTNALPIDGSATMPGTNAPNGTTSDWTVTGTISWKTVNLVTDYVLYGNQFVNGKQAIYTVNWYSGSTQIGTQTVYGQTTIGAYASGTPQLSAVQMTGGTQIRAVVTRIGDAWNTSGTFPSCGYTGNCGADVPASTTGNIGITLSAVTGSEYNLGFWMAAGSQQVSGWGSATSVYPLSNTGNTVTCVIRE